MRYLFVADLTTLHVHEVDGRIEAIHCHHFGPRPHIHSASYLEFSHSISRGFAAYRGLRISWDEYSQNAFYVGRMH